MSLSPGTILGSVTKMLPSSQAQRGDRKLQEAHDMTVQNEDIISEEDHRVIKEKITFAEETKHGLDSKWGIPKFLHAQEYRRNARDAYRFAKTVSERALANQRDRPWTPEDIDDRIRLARSNYRCHLSCKDAFPPHRNEEWSAIVWSDACARTGGQVSALPPDEEFVYTSMMLFDEIKATIRHDIKTLYGFDTSLAPDIIGRNATRAQALLTEMAFIYHEPNFGRTPRHPYRHPIIQTVVNIVWFQDRDSDGVVFHDHFTPMLIQTIALTLTAIECCIGEWTEGTHKESKWDEEGCKSIYHSHIKSLNDLRDHSSRQGEDLVAQLQRDLLRTARAHAGAPLEPVTGAGRFPQRALDAAVRDGLPPYSQADDGSQIPTINISDES